MVLHLIPFTGMNFENFIIIFFYFDASLIRIERHLVVIKLRDPRTKTGWSRTERFGPGPPTGPDQGRKIEEI